jgi:Ca2+-binding RTX toxin-like protein
MGIQMSRRTLPRLNLSIAALTATAGFVAVAPHASAIGETCGNVEATIVGAGTISGTPGNDVIVGSPGDDMIYAGQGNDLICADSGNDDITDGPGADLVFAGPGDDRFFQGAAADADDSLRGESGTDEVSYTLRSDPLSIDLDGGGGGTGESDYIEEVENLTTGSGADIVTGTPGDNVIHTGDGDDSVSGGDGNDIIGAQGGNDSAAGGAGDDGVDVGFDGSLSHNEAVGGDGDDHIYGSNGIDTVFGGAGNDTIYDFAGNDVIHGQTDSDTVNNGLGKDKVFLDEGDDAFIAHSAKDTNDVVDGGDGSDTADYSSRTGAVKLRLNTTTADDGAAGEADKLLLIENAIGGGGADTLVGTTGDNSLSGGGGNDVITDLAGADTVDGGAGNDKVSQGNAPDVGDTLSGGDGVDTISYAARPAGFVSGVIIDLDSTYGTSGIFGELDVLSSFENAVGGPENEAIYGTDAPNIITAGNGNDHVEGMGANDTITTGGGGDLVYDGPGSDKVTLSGGCDWVIQSEYSAGDVIDAGTGTCDKIDYADRTDDLSINLGTTAAVNGGAGEADVLKGFERATGGFGDDVIRGSGAANILAGGRGFETFASPDDGADVLLGLGGADTLVTYDQVAGNDSADGGFGTDNGSFDTGDMATSVEAPQFF